MVEPESSGVSRALREGGQGNVQKWMDEGEFDCIFSNSTTCDLGEINFALLSCLRPHRITGTVRMLSARAVQSIQRLSLRNLRTSSQLQSVPLPTLSPLPAAHVTGEVCTACPRDRGDDSTPGKKSVLTSDSFPRTDPRERRLASRPTRSTNARRRRKSSTFDNESKFVFPFFSTTPRILPLLTRNEQEKLAKMKEAISKGRKDLEQLEKEHAEMEKNGNHK